MDFTDFGISMVREIRGTSSKSLFLLQVLFLELPIRARVSLMREIMCMKVGANEDR
jgi:hypothetical protein